jgi:serine/threonine-protein kinase
MAEALRDKLQAALGDRYTLERELGGGGMSRVFVATDTTLGRALAVKIVPGETAAGVSLDRFWREIQVAARLQHPHIVPLLSAGQVGDLPFYTMPFVKGESLRARLSRGGELSINEAVHVLRDVAAALAYAHSEGVVHRDIKPDNVIVSGGVAVVTDFGVAKAMDLAATEAGATKVGITSFGVALGTPAYMSPEQASADTQIDHRADIYSFGCLAYELLTGASPFAGRPAAQQLAGHMSETPDDVLKRRPSTPPQLAALVMRCLEKRPGDRPQRADELIAALDSIATTPSGGLPPAPSEVWHARRRSMAWVAIGVVSIAAIVVVARVARQSSAPKPLSVGSTTQVAVTAALEG